MKRRMLEGEILRSRSVSCAGRWSRGLGIRGFGLRGAGCSVCGFLDPNIFGGNRSVGSWDERGTRKGGNVLVLFRPPALAGTVSGSLMVFEER